VKLFVEEMERASEAEKRKILERHARSLQNLGEPSESHKFAAYTHKPVVGKLNPTLVLGVA